VSRRSLRALTAGLLLLALPALARAQSAEEEAPPPRFAVYEWDSDQRFLYATLSYRDVVDASLRQKLQKGLPTTILFSAAVYLSGAKTPVATTVQSCKVTWHVWEEAYRIDLTQPGTQNTVWTTTVDGVLRRCADARQLLIASRLQAPPGQPVFLEAKVQVNPLSAQLLERIKRWVSRPTATDTAAPGDALFGTFTGLFLQRIGEAERVLEFTTVLAVPRVRPKSR
jgi:hypothetical protein